MVFDRFVAVDWSGARGPRLAGLQVAECHYGKATPVLVENPNGGRLRRNDLFNWISTQINGNEKIIIGFDFSFAFPYCDFKTYFPCSVNSPENIRDLWAKVDGICALQKEFYAGPFYLTESAPYAEYLLYQNYKGKKYNSRLRCTEIICKKSYTSPACTFKCVGPDSVGIGSICGMRFLHKIKEEFGQNITIWPFDDNLSAQCIIVEIFPRYYFHLARQNPHLWREHICLNDTLKFYDTEPLPEELNIVNEDQADAIVSSVALRNLVKKPNVWKPVLMTSCAKKYEGWIFGIIDEGHS